jgi:hypothetical protein
MSKHLPLLSLAAALALTLGGCTTIRNAAGISKELPDEFAVVSKAPLIIPPEFNLRPPQAGAAATNQISPTASAQEALYSDDPAVVAAGMTGNYSPAEKQFLAQTGAANADNSIRQLIAADNKGMQAADDSFTNQVLFGALSSNADGTPVDAAAEKQRIDDGKAQVPAGTAKPAPEPEKKDSGGWLDGIF